MRQWHQAEPHKVLCNTSVTAGKTASGYSDFADAVHERNGNCTKKASGQDNKVQEAYFESWGPVAEDVSGQKWSGKLPNIQTWSGSMAAGCKWAGSCGQKWSGKLPNARDTKLETYSSMPLKVRKSENEGELLEDAFLSKNARNGLGGQEGTPPKGEVDTAKPFGFRVSTFDRESGRIGRQPRGQSPGHLGSTLMSAAAREARAGFGFRVAVTSPQPDFRV